MHGELICRDEQASCQACWCCGKPGIPLLAMSPPSCIELSCPDCFSRFWCNEGLVLSHTAKDACQVVKHFVPLWRSILTRTVYPDGSALWEERVHAGGTAKLWYRGLRL